MGERPDGRWLTPQVAVSTPRQNGKSQLIVARALAGILLFGEQLIIVSAHQQDTAREVFIRLVDILEFYPALDARVESYGRALNREYIRFKSGQVIRFKARSKGGGRGFSCDCLLLDEAQILDAPSWAAILPTMSARPNPQVWLFGTPPTPQDDGEVFTRIRTAAIEGKQTRLAYLEWSADPEDDPASPDTWAKANPAYGTRIDDDAILGELTAMTPDQFSLERLGIWISSITVRPLIDKNTWGMCKSDDERADGALFYGIRFSVDGSAVAISGASRSSDDPVRVELIANKPMSLGNAWLVDWIMERARVADLFILDGKSHRDAVVNALIGRGLDSKKMLLPSTDQVIAAHTMFLDSVQSKTMTHWDDPGQAELDASVGCAIKRPIGTAGGWGWKPIGIGDVLPVESATLALFGALMSSTKKKRTGQTVFG